MRRPKRRATGCVGFSEDGLYSAARNCVCPSARAYFLVIQGNKLVLRDGKTPSYRTSSASPRAENRGRHGTKPGARCSAPARFLRDRSHAKRCRETPPMSQLVQIAPGVLFSSDVLSPEWGREYRREEGTAEVVRNTNSARRPGNTAKEGGHDTRESIGSQMSLL